MVATMIYDHEWHDAEVQRNFGDVSQLPNHPPYLVLMFDAKSRILLRRKIGKLKDKTPKFLRTSALTEYIRPHRPRYCSPLILANHHQQIG